MYDYDTKSPFLWPDNSDQGFAVINDAELASGGKSAASGNVQVQATGGAAVEVKWDTWPESHKVSLAHEKPSFSSRIALEWMLTSRAL
jgi:hypothetical protein